MRGKHGVVAIAYADRVRDQEVLIYGGLCVTESETLPGDWASPLTTWSITHHAIGYRLYRGFNRKALLRAASQLADDPAIGPIFADHSTVEAVCAALTNELHRRCLNIIGKALLTAEGR